MTYDVHVTAVTPHIGASIVLETSGATCVQGMVQMDNRENTHVK
jgi:hypothetical protein